MGCGVFTLVGYSPARQWRGGDLAVWRGTVVVVPGAEFLLADASDAGVEAVWAALGGRYRAEPTGRRQQVRVWLDTFDGRLRRAGLTLAYVGPVRAGRAAANRVAAANRAAGVNGATAVNGLQLSTPDGVLWQPVTVRWPAPRRSSPATDGAAPTAEHTSPCPVPECEEPVMHLLVVGGSDAGISARPSVRRGQKSGPVLARNASSGT